YLKDSSYSGAKALGRGVNYKYPHNYENHYVEQDYLPANLSGKIYYKPTDLGYESVIKERLNFLKGKKK
ncbi:replication-associated recombination protein A, partial [Vibrio parahaemolyticus]|nr:replication-associated recombination protein A [Vibrio parahaemolyticus]